MRRPPVATWSLLVDDAAAEADGDRVRAAAGLELRQQVPDVALDGLLGEEEPLADLAVHEAVRDQLKHLDLAHRGLLLELSERGAEGDDLPDTALPPRGQLVEATSVVRVAVQDLLALGS